MPDPLPARPRARPPIIGQHLAQRGATASDVVSIDEAARTVEVVFTTGEIIPHWLELPRGVERVMTRIRVTPETLDLERLVGQPVLNAHEAHSTSAVIGVVEAAWIARGQGLARLRFSAAEDVAPIWQRIREKVLRNVSLGFVVRAAEAVIEDTPAGPLEVWHLTRIEPFEISVVPIGADPGARVQALSPLPSVPPIEETDMPDTPHTPTPAPAPVTPPAAPLAQGTAAPLAQGTPAPAADPAPQAAAPDAETILRQERARVAAITETGAALGLAPAMIRQALEGATSAETFRAEAIRQFAARGAEATQGIGGATQAAVVTADASERFVQGATLGLMARSGLRGGERNEFTGMTLAEIARQSLDLHGLRPGADRMKMVGMAFTQGGGAHSTSDFAHVLSNLMGKGALQGWEAAPETFQLWTRTGSLTDFKPASRVGLGLVSALPQVAEGAEYNFGTIGDRGETIALATYGRLLRITRQAIINDDLGLLTELPRKMGMAARRTIGNLVYAVLTGNPVLSDGKALFHPDHANLAAAGAAPGVTSLSAARAAMRVQKEDPTRPDSPALNITPAFLLVPAALETMAQRMMTSSVDPGDNKGHAPNPVANMAQVITDARLDAASTSAWYLAANGTVFDTIEVAYLDGREEPYIEEREGWSSDGVEVKVRIDAGVAPLDFRTLYKNPGA